MTTAGSSATRIEAGDTIPAWRVETVDAEHMKVLALLLGDPNPIHFDVGAARSAGVSRQINQGPSNMAMLVNALRLAFPAGRLVSIDFRLSGRVVAGQAAQVEGEVVDVRSSSDGDVVACSARLVVEGATVMHARAEIVVPGDAGGARA